MEIRRLFTWRVNLYRLVVGAVVLAIVLPSWAAGVRATWLVVTACILVVIAGVVIGRQVPLVRGWLRR
jgi:hypothetical protein